MSQIMILSLNSDVKDHYIVVVIYFCARGGEEVLRILLK